MTDPREASLSAFAARVEAIEAERDEAIAERDAARDRIERALGALRDPKATNWERVQAAGLILTEGQET